MARLLVKNHPNTWLKGEVVGIFPDTQNFGRMESKTNFLLAWDNPDSLPENFPTEWPKEFVIINIDEPMENLQFLLEEHEERRRYYIKEQFEDSPVHPDLSQYAECTMDMGFLMSQLVDRGA